jgi:hypothetical protein
MMNEIDVDALMDSIEAPSADRQMSDGAEAAEQPVEQAPAQADAPQWEIDYRGQKVKADSFDKFRQWAQQGYDYSQRMADLKRQQQEYESKYKGFDRYAEVDEYAKQNKEWWNHVEQAWQTRDQFQASMQGQDPLAPIKSEFNELKSFVSELKEERTKEQIRQQDEALNGEMKSIQDKYPDLDFNAVDDSGYSLEYRILKHANEIGTNSFRAAFNDYYHDKLTQMAASKALANQAKEQQVNAKKGLLGTSPTPRKAVARAENVRGKSYDALTQEALAEFGIT